jgi:pSer/pThr/pTyr-binding forkhead associated (FHA) protein
MSIMPKLSVTTEGSGKVTHELTDELITIGRAPENVIVIDDFSVSGRHAQLQLVGETYHLKDLGSTNGTRVNGQTIDEAQVRVGDRLRFGKVEGRFESDVSGGTQLLPQIAEIESKPAESSARPQDFANASPFRERRKEKDPARTAMFAAAALALVIFLGSMIAVLFMHVPVQ